MSNAYHQGSVEMEIRVAVMEGALNLLEIGPHLHKITNNITNLLTGRGRDTIRSMSISLLDLTIIEIAGETTLKDQKTPLIMQWGEGIGRGVKVTQGVVGGTSMEGKVALFKQQMLAMISEENKPSWVVHYMVKNQIPMKCSGLIPQVFRFPGIVVEVAF